MKRYYFSHSRTALKYGLIALKLKKGDCVHIPDYICDVILHPLKQLGLTYKYYKITDRLEPDWSHLEKSLTEKSKAILMVHYFGQPQDIEKFQSFCKERALWLLEDNAHGVSGKYKDQLLGTFGDVGISAPRKTLELDDGGILYINNKDVVLSGESLSSLQDNNLSYEKQVIKSFLKKRYLLKKIVRRVSKQPDYTNLTDFHELEISDVAISRYSKEAIEKCDMNSIQSERMAVYKKWEEFAAKNGLTPVFESYNLQSCPLAFPVYMENAQQSKEWFDWGWRYGFNVYSWPSLPIEVIEKGGDSVDRWKRLVCFPIESGVYAHVDSIVKK